MFNSSADNTIAQSIMADYSVIPQSDLNNLQSGLDSLHNLLKISLTSGEFNKEERMQIVQNYEQLEQLVIQLRIRTAV